jgi:hypothetical protein
LAVGDDAIQLSEKTGTVPCQKAIRWRRAQPPAQGGAAALFHPTEGAGGTEIARIGFDDQGIWVNLFQPGNDPLLPAQIERVTGVEQVAVAGSGKLGVFEFVGGRNGLDGKRVSGEEVQAAFAGLGHEIEEGRTVGRENSLLDGERAGE